MILTRTNLRFANQQSSKLPQLCSELRIKNSQPDDFNFLIHSELAKYHIVFI